jgi:hypothetical protein
VVKGAVTYAESDCIARVSTSENTLAWFPVYLNEGDGQAYISRFGKWEAIEGLAGFEGFEKLKTKRLFDTATGKLASHLKD